MSKRQQPVEMHYSLAYLADELNITKQGVLYLLDLYNIVPYKLKTPNSKRSHALYLVEAQRTELLQKQVEKLNPANRRYAKMRQNKAEKLNGRICPKCDELFLPEKAGQKLCKYCSKRKKKK